PVQLLAQLLVLFLQALLASPKNPAETATPRRRTRHRSAHRAAGRRGRIRGCNRRSLRTGGRARRNHGRPIVEHPPLPTLGSGGQAWIRHPARRRHPSWRRWRPAGRGVEPVPRHSAPPRPRTASQLSGSLAPEAIARSFGSFGPIRQSTVPEWPTVTRATADGTGMAAGRQVTLWPLWPVR